MSAVGGDQLEMFAGEAHARKSDPGTSQQAAHRVNAKELEKRVHRLLHGYGAPLNTKEIAELLGVHVWSISPRMKPLEERGLVRRTTGRRGKSILWEAV